jgi:O-methyltransferase involved in polyketide biosynthesis
MAAGRSDQISPTAHYTGYVWFRHGLSSPEFATREGRLLHAILTPIGAVSRAIGGPTLEGFLLARHRLIDLRLERAIAAGTVGQVLEIAAGLSPRGWRFSQRYGDRVQYVEADLPDMAARKRAVLTAAGDQSPSHRVVEIDALAEGGSNSLDAVLATFDARLGIAVVTEGLIHYLPRAALIGMWSRLARALVRFPDAMYLSDLHLGCENRSRAENLFLPLLSAFVRNRVQLQFEDEAEVRRELAGAGFTRCELHRPMDFASQIGPLEEAGARLVRVLEARL